ncbi:type 1 glutamine amidotransferase [Candidatus Magnetominusculus xianensis]|uniref:Glutamine amidotransferase n=1 Tax=Candidatus Magnetominusculus xianensis TaxID=1748249 RepID=A0ABR5SE71_9BACT|nr:type 1 glutamine amidotransferase [Candidatus Magnetominusculus xianensis]KWT84058.1 glutamine amidotransferase [Candidatus Magnetominusculus xianensis]MBF0402351.1 type 1 glutamine amidotransferase [Nitrospirota bacterium]
MSVLIIKNIEAEGPGTIEDYLKENSIAYTIVNIAHELAPNTDGFDTLIIMGGPMSVNDEDDYLRVEEQIVRQFIGTGRKVLGICLGAQMIAKALGASVYKGPAPEIGWYTIAASEAGIADTAFSRLAVKDTSDLIIFHWHGETFDLPEGAVRLASNALYPNQAFRYGKAVYAFQFHMEVNREMVYSWMKTENMDMAKLKAETEEIYPSYSGRAIAFYKEFFDREL